MSSLDSMTAETGRLALNRNNMEKNGLRVKLTRLDGEREETLFDIKRKEKSILTKRRSFRIRRDNCKRTENEERKSRTTESTKQTIERGTCHSMRHLQGSLRRSRTESYLPCLPNLPSYNQRMQSLRRQPQDHSRSETPVPDADSELDHDHKGGTKSSLESVKHGTVKHSLDLDLAKRVSSDEKLDYLVRNVFERLYHGARSLKKPQETHLNEDFNSLRSCRYLRLPVLK